MSPDLHCTVNRTSEEGGAALSNALAIGLHHTLDAVRRGVDEACGHGHEAGRDGSVAKVAARAPTEFLDPFLVPKQPIFKALWDFLEAKMGHHKLKTV